jgi:hypothetical protein
MHRPNPLVNSKLAVYVASSQKQEPDAVSKSPSTKRRVITTETNKEEVVILRHRNNGPLHDLLLKACPANEDGEKSITILADTLGISAWSIHKWVQKGKIPPGRAVEVVDISDGRVTLADFSPFVYV